LPRLFIAGDFDPAKRNIATTGNAGWHRLRVCRSSVDFTRGVGWSFGSSVIGHASRSRCRAAKIFAERLLASTSSWLAGSGLLGNELSRCQ
jgi:hypothetical protein